MLETLEPRPAVVAQVLVAAILAIIGFVTSRRYFHSLSDIPGPFWASVSRLWLGIHVATGDFEKEQRELHEKHGKVFSIQQT